MYLIVIDDIGIEIQCSIAALIKLTISSFQLADEAFKEALGDGIWCNIFDTDLESKSDLEQSDAHAEAQPSSRNQELKNLINSSLYPVDASSIFHQYKDMQLFHRLEEQGTSLELPWSKVSILFNLARVLEQMNKTESASILYRLIVYKVLMFY